MKLKVIYKGRYLAGLLWREDGFYRFEYDDQFIENDDLYAISVNMPKSQKSYESKYLFANFQSILSEGYNREIQCKALGIDQSDDWNLLIYTCAKDTIGAITVEKTIYDGSM